MRPLEFHGLAEATEHGRRRGQVVAEAVRQPRGRPEAGQIHGDHLALRREDVHHRVPDLPVVTDPVQQEQRFAAPHARVVDGHALRAVGRGNREGDGGGHGVLLVWDTLTESGGTLTDGRRQLVSNRYRRVDPAGPEIHGEA